MLSLVDWLLFMALGLPALYLFVFAAASMRTLENSYLPARKQHKFVILIPAYKGDMVVEQAAISAMDQEYPSELYRVVVIADHLQQRTIVQLKARSVEVIEVNFEQSSKAKALNYAIEQLGPQAAEMVAILDVDNIVGRNFISRLNDAYDSGTKAIQAHRAAQNRDTHTAVLDAASEEINNSIFRKGHVALGLSSALVGSGMAFDYSWFCRNIVLCTTAGEDKELEVLLLRQGIYIDYLDDVIVLDEKVREQSSFYNQRRRWLAAQFFALGAALRNLPGAIVSGNKDYCDKLIQWCIPPRILLMGLTPMCAVVATFVDPIASIKWWIAASMLLFALAMALPDNQMDNSLKRALRQIPMLFVLMAANLFRIRGAKNRFNHTEHGGEIADNK